MILQHVILAYDFAACDFLGIHWSEMLNLVLI